MTSSTRERLHVESTRVRVSSGHARLPVLYSCSSTVRNLKFFYLIRHLPTIHEVSSDRVHTLKTRLSFFIKIAVFRRNVWNTWVRAMSFYSANRIDACMYSVPRKHEDKRGVCIKVHRSNVWSHKTMGLHLHLAPLARPLFPLLRVFCFHMAVDVA